MLLFFAGMACAMLCRSRTAASLALEGLSLWFERMIPALLPFMILSGLLIGLELSDSFAALFAPILRPVLRLSDSCLYCVVIGFLCGFPMGAKVCAQSYQKGKISRQEATLLLAFSNNIGPAYFAGYVLHLFPAVRPLPALLIMYGLPFGYGILLRYTLFRAIPPAPLRKTSRPAPGAALTAERVFFSLNASIQDSLNAVTALGGYMISCNMLELAPLLLFSASSRLYRLTGPLLEITGGLSRLRPEEAPLGFVLLPFGGLSCIAQTYSCIHGTGLSLKEYVFHKTVQTVLTLACWSAAGPALLRSP